MLRFTHPFMGFDVPAILGDHVTLDAGTGAVHTAPGHGPDDYVIGQKYWPGKPLTRLARTALICRALIRRWMSVNVFKANDIVRCAAAGKKARCCTLRKCSTAIRAAVASQNADHLPRDAAVVRQHGSERSAVRSSLKEIKGVQWIPDWGQARIESMVANRPDWCISRQRTWGVPMSLFVHKDTEELHPRTLELMEEVAKRVEVDGIQAWWDLDAKEILGDEADQYVKVPDTLDVWFDSGSTHSSVVDVRPEFAGHAADMYLEGSDQHRGWFMSSLMISTAMKGKAPYRQVLTHGFTVDGQGSQDV